MEVDIDYIAIGKRIRSARLAKKMTQETLSNMIDVTPTYISSQFKTFILYKPV